MIFAEYQTRHQHGPYCDHDITDSRFERAWQLQSGDVDHPDADGDPAPVSRYDENRELD